MAKTATGTANWNTNGAWVGSVQPTAADDVIIPSGAVITIPTGTTVLGRSLEVQSGGTLIWASTSAQLSLGDGTAGAGNSVINISSGATITLTGIGVINLLSTSATTQTITTNGKTMPTIVVNGANSNYQHADNYTSSGNYTYTLGASVDFNSKTIQVSAFGITSNANVRSIIWGTAVLNCTLFGGTPFIASGAVNVTITASVGAQLNATNGNSPNISLGSLDYSNVAVSHTTSSAITATLISTGATIYSYTRTGGASKTEVVNLSGTGVTISNSLSINGNSATNRILIKTSTVGTQFTITNNGSNSVSNIDVQDVVAAGTASWNLSAITGLSGDCGNNSGITFTSGISVYWVPQGGTSTGNWSNSSKWASASGGTGGTGRVPLPQDSVFIDGNSIDAGSRTITIDMPRVGGNVDFTGVTNNPTITWTSSLAQTFYGNVTFVSGITFSFENTVNWVLAGRGTHTFTTGGKTFTGTNMSPSIDCGGGSYTCQDAFTMSHGLTLNSGSFYCNGFTMTWATFTSTSTNTRAFYLGASIINITGTTGTPWNITAAGITFDAGTSQIVISSTSASTRTFAGGGLLYYTIDYTLSGSTGRLTITGSNRFRKVSFKDASNARTLAFTSSAVNVIEILDVIGTSGKLMSIIGATASSATFLMLIGPVNTVDYLSIQDVVSTLPHKFYAGANSTLVSNTVGIITSAPPTQPYVNQSITSGSSAATGQTATGFYYPVTAGSLLVAYIGSVSDPGTITPPSGWNLAISKAQGMSTYSYIYYKVADGSETSITFNWVNSRSSQLVVEEIKGWNGVPTLDTTDSNGGASGTTISTGSGATNSANPGISVAMVHGNGGMGLTPNASPPTNSFQEDYVQQNGANAGPKVAVKPLLANASQSTTFTWTANRVPASALANFIDVANTYQPRHAFVNHSNPGIF